MSLFETKSINCRFVIFLSGFLFFFIFLINERSATAQTDELKVLVAQPLVTPGDIQGNISRMEPLIAEAAKRGSDLVVFSECAITGYDYKGISAKAAIPQTDPALTRVSALAKKYKIAIIAGFHEKDGSNLRNSAIVFYPDGKRILQRKHRIEDPEMAICPVTAGPRERTLFKVKGFTCAILICSDDGIDGIYEELAQKKCDVAILITAGAGHESFGFHKAQLADSSILKKFAHTTASSCLSEDLVARCFKLGMALVACNQMGWQTDIGYFHPGGSCIIDKTGDVSAVIPMHLIFETLKPQIASGSVSKIK
jgi:predicted amidohydrolase